MVVGKSAVNRTVSLHPELIGGAGVVKIQYYCVLTVGGIDVGNRSRKA